jgi:NitT/TauT family transport system ATP-binding protein
MTDRIVAAFVPLVDCAVLVAAKEKGFARACGIELELVKEPSWASLRDHLRLGYVDCAHALAPLAIASELGIAQVRANTFVPLVLGRGGNAITLSRGLADGLRGRVAEPRDPNAWGRALATYVRAHAEPLTLGMVYPFSGHNYELRHWLAAAGIHPDRDVRLVSIPPPRMVESLSAGQVDGFCVGEPWNSLAVQQGLGEIVAAKSQLFVHAIEKVLAVRDAMKARPAKLQALLAGLVAAAEWADDPANNEALACMLAHPDYVDLPAELIARSLTGRLVTGRAEPLLDHDFLYFSRHSAGYPEPSQALWTYAQMVRWGQVPESPRLEQLALRVFEPEVLFGGMDAPSRGQRRSTGDAPEVRDGEVGAYLDRFTIHTPCRGPVLLSE